MSSSKLSFLVRKRLMSEISSVVTFVPVCQYIPHHWVHKVEKILKFFSSIFNKENHFLSIIICFSSGITMLMRFLIERYLLHSLQLLLGPGCPVVLHVVVRPLGAGQAWLGLEASEVRVLVHSHVRLVTCSSIHTLVSENRSMLDWY